MNTSVILAVLLASLATVGLGVSLLRVVGFKSLPTTLMLGAGYGVGVVVISQLLHLASHADVGLSMAGWCLVGLGLAACVWLVRAEIISCNITPPETAGARYVGLFRSGRIWARDPVVVALLVLVAAHLVITLINNALRPVFPWDAFTTWMYRAKAWALQDAITAMAFTPDWIHEPTGSGYAIYASQYPTALSIYAALLSSLTGGWQPAAASAPWSLALTASGLTLHGILRLAGISQRLSVIGAYLLVSLPLLNVHAALAGYGDLWMALYSGGGLAALLIWRTFHRATALWLSLTLLAAGTQIKTEGWVWLLLGITFLLLEAISSRIGYTKLVAGIVALAGLIWSLDITLLSLGPLGQWGIDDSRLYAGAIGNFNIRPYNPLTNYWAILFDQANFLLAAGFYFLALAAISLKRDERHLGSVWTMSLLIAASQIIIFGLSSYSEYAETGTAIARLLLHFSPVVVVTVIVGWSSMTCADSDANMQARETSNLTASRSERWLPLVLVTALSAAFLVPITALLLNTTSPSLAAANISMANVVGRIEKTDMGTRFLASPINVGVLKAPSAVSAPPPRYLIADVTAPDSESVSFYWINSGETQVNSTPVNLSGRSVTDLNRYGAWRSGGKKELGFLVHSQAFEQSYVRGFSLTDTLSADIIPALLNHWSAAEPLTQATINNTMGHAESAMSVTFWVNGGLVFVAVLGALLICKRHRASYQVLIGGSLIGLWLTVDTMTLANTPMLDCLTGNPRCLATGEADPHARGLVQLSKELKANTPTDKPIIVVNAGDSLGAQKLPLLLLPKATVYVSSHQVPADWAFDIVVLGNNAEALNDTALSLKNKLARSRVIDFTNAKLIPGPI